MRGGYGFSLWKAIRKELNTFNSKVSLIRENERRVNSKDR